jgi:hypothetical protein
MLQATPSQIIELRGLRLDQCVRTSGKGGEG